jgi:hypothetical protein
MAHTDHHGTRNVEWSSVRNPNRGYSFNFSAEKRADRRVARNLTRQGIEPVASDYRRAQDARFWQTY